MIRQRTIKDPVVMQGVGLQTGGSVTLTMKSSPANSGINFIRTDLPNKPLLNLQSLNLEDTASAERRTTLGIGPLQIQTTEHLLAAVAALAIDNIVIELDGLELPGMDGSARDFLAALEKAGTAEQDAPKKIIQPKETLWCGAGDSLLAIFPDDDFRVSYTLSYPGIGAQFFTSIVNKATFEKDIAPARTFCSEAEAMELIQRGLGKGANYENTLVMGRAGPINTTLRFADEPVRHKVLDLIGDLYCAGAQIKGHVVGIKSGHRLNMELVKKIKGLVKL